MGSASPFWRQPDFLSYWLPPVIWALAVLSLSGDLGAGKNTLGLLKWLLSWFMDLEPAQLKLINFYVRKTGHVLAYGLMCGLWLRAFRAQAHYSPRRACLWALGLCLCLATFDEGRQWFFASRGASLRDVCLDMSGAGLVAVIGGAVWAPGSKTTVIPAVAQRHTAGPD